MHARACVHARAKKKLKNNKDTSKNHQLSSNRKKKSQILKFVFLSDNLMMKQLGRGRQRKN